MNLPTVRRALPSTANPNAPGVGLGDIYVDPAGGELPAIVQGPVGAQVLVALGGGSGGSVTIALPILGGIPATIRAEVRDGVAPVAGAIVLFSVTTQSAIVSVTNPALEGTMIARAPVPGGFTGGLVFFCVMMTDPVTGNCAFELTMGAGRGDALATLLSPNFAAVGGGW